MTEKLNILIVEDEYITLKSISQTLMAMGYHIAGAAMNAQEALNILESKTVDLAILDINLKSKQDGIWLANQLEKYRIPFIFLTAYSDKKTIDKAIKTKPASYIIKPFQKFDLYAAIETALVSYKKPETPSETTNTPKHIIVKCENSHIKLLLKDIEYIKALGNYIQLVVKDKHYTHRLRFKHFLNTFPNKKFIQSHRSYLVNISKIKEVRTKEILLKNYTIPLSKKYQKSLLSMLNES